jgi:hypothetical protein
MPNPYPNATYPVAYTEADMLKSGAAPVNDVVSEVVSIATDGTGGTFTLTFMAVASGALAFDISAANLKTALELNANITTVEVTGTGGASTPWLITFVDPAGNVGAITADDTNLTGETLGTVVTVVTIGDGSLTVEDVAAGSGPL